MVYKPHFFTLNFPGKLGMQLICESIWTPCCKFACLLRQKSILHDHEPDQMPGYKATSERTEAFILLYVKALANLDTLLPTQLFPRLHAHATFVADTNFVSGTQRMFLILFRNISCPQQMFPSLRSPRNIMGNNVSAKMCPRLPGP